MPGIEKRPSVRRILGKVSLERGKIVETRIGEIFRRFIGQEICPSWLLGYEEASEDDDKKGIDGWVVTDIGKIPVQIKSSSKGARTALKKRPQIAVLVIANYSAKDEEILSRCLPIISQKREEFLGRRGNKE